MAEVEKLGDDFLPFNEKSVSRVPVVAGTFVLADKNREIIYIGFGGNLNKLLINIIRSGNYCISHAYFFQISINPDTLRGAASLFIQYKEEHSGMFPRCNKFDLSVNR